MPRSPRKIGLIVTGGNPWEIVFSIFHLEKNNYLRLPITVGSRGRSPQETCFEEDLSRLSTSRLEDVKVTGIEAVIIPGGMRLFNDVCDFEVAGKAMKVDDRLKNLLKGIYRLGKPIGAFGPAALVVSKALQGITGSGPVVTVGNDPRLQSGIESTGAQSVVTRPGEVVLDETNKLVTSGGELGTRRVCDIYAACENLLSGLVELIKAGSGHEGY
jgi:enhancing lycopene biosynthesis protein 2